jgi:adenylyl- and sulfurtransferase ThiI
VRRAVSGYSGIETSLERESDALKRPDGVPEAVNHVLVRDAEAGANSDPVEDRLLALLGERVAERLAHEGIDSAVEHLDGIFVGTATTLPAARAVAELPGVASASPAVRTSPDAVGQRPP